MRLAARPFPAPYYLHKSSGLEVRKFYAIYFIIASKMGDVYNPAAARRAFPRFARWICRLFTGRIAGKEHHFSKTVNLWHKNT